MDAINQAFSEIHRVDFIPDDLKGEADIDAPLPIGYRQTISQPTTVRWMLEWLDPQTGDKILDIGSGSGWTTALLSNLVGPKGEVLAVEIVPELVEFGRDNCRKAGVSHVRFFPAAKSYGLPEYAPYDRILVSAAADELPDSLLGQLKNGGKLVIPIGNDILEVTKTSAEDHKTIVHPGFVFVPLV